MAVLTLIEKFHQRVRAEGFELSGAVDLSSSQALFQKAAQRYQSWIDDGFAGEMNYLVRGLERRRSPELVFPDVKSVWTVAFPYRTEPAGSLDSRQGVRYARYIRGRDYHLEMAERLEKVMTGLKSDAPSDFRWKVCVDTSAILERTWGALTGLGWIGKNGMLIHPQLGSYFLLGVVLVNQEAGKTPMLLKDYCGNCERCLLGCPTQAIVAAAKVDSRKCISYWTLEKRGDLSLSEVERQAMGNWVAGCDICQEVCPFNQKPSREVRVGLPGRDATELSDFTALANETRENYLERVAESSLSRVKPEMFRRNLELIKRTL